MKELDFSKLTEKDIERATKLEKKLNYSIEEMQKDIKEIFAEEKGE